MMDIQTQIMSLTVSFIYGMFFSNMIKINYNFIVNKSNKIKYILTFVFIFMLSCIYFILLKKINNAIIHPYFIIALFLGFLIAYMDMFKKIAKYILKNKD